MADEKMNDYLRLQQALAQLQTTTVQQDGDEIELTELLNAMWRGKWLIIAITAVFAFGSVAYALSLPNIYKAEALVAPAAQENSGMGGISSQLGGLASLAGISIGGGTDKTALAIEIMKSRMFVTKFIDKHELLVPLMATKGWKRSSNQLVYDINIYDINTKEWNRQTKAPFKPKPSAQEAYKAFNKIVSTDQNKTTAMVTISVKHYSPEIAKQWVDWLIDAINLEMKLRELTEAEKSISYLEGELKKTKINELQEVLYQIIEEQTKIVMFANIRKQYAFKTIDPALIPEIKYSPARAMICVLGTLLGGMFSIMIILIGFFNTRRHSK